MQCLVVTPSLPSYFFFMNKRRCTEYTDFFAMQTPIPPRSHCRFVFLHGAPGTGKTSLALDFAKHVAQGDGLAHYLKPHSKGWDGYRSQKVVIMDEAEPRCWKELEADGTAVQGVRAQGVRGGIRVVRETCSGRVLCLLHKVLRIAAVLLPMYDERCGGSSTPHSRDAKRRRDPSRIASAMRPSR